MSYWDELVRTRKLMERAVRGYLNGGGMKAVDLYATGRPEYRRELLKFAEYVKKYGEPVWFN